MSLFLCDVDGVIADFTGAVLDLVRQGLGKAFTPLDVTTWSFKEALGLTDDEWREVSRGISVPGFAHRIEPTAAVARRGDARLGGDA